MPKKSTKKKITLDDLGLMIAQGFKETASKKELGTLEERMTRIEAEMVTKSYLDDKLADLEGTVIVRQRKEDHKVNLLIEFLKKKKILGKTELKMLKEIQ